METSKASQGYFFEQCDRVKHLEGGTICAPLYTVLELTDANDWLVALGLTGQ